MIIAAITYLKVSEYLEQERQYLPVISSSGPTLRVAA
jgi:hypothetical protein